MKKNDILLRLFLCFILLYSISLIAQDKMKAATPKPAPPDNTPKYKNPSLPLDDRVADLLSRMTLEEKIAQIAPPADRATHVVDPTGTFTDESASAMMSRWYDPDLIFPARKAAILRNGVQRYLKEKTRLGIPELFMGEALHGFMEYGSTSFPQALSLASTWDPDLVQQVFTAAGDEAASAGVGQAFTPVLDIARDPRWGRTEETYGEDPFLAARMGVAAITGLQGDSFLINRHHVAATAKHFAVHGQPEGGTNTAPGNYSERIIRENFLVPFQAAVQEAHAASVMASYNEIDGVPSHINHWLLDKVLRQEWGFRGYITSDGNGLQMLTETHHIAANNADAARMALAAGVDYDLSDGSVYRTLLWQVKLGTVPEAMVDRAVARVLATKFRLGLFDNPYVEPDYAERTTNSAEHRALALKTAEKAVVLLKNDKNLLPLDLTKLKTIAVIGPNAAGVHLGGYSRDPLHGVSLLQGIKDRVGNRASIVYAEGCKITDQNDWHGWFANDVKLIDPATQVDNVKAAAEAAKKSDVAILVVGENESTNREAWSENHLGDRDSLELLGAQNDLVKAVVETGTPTVVLLINGRPLSVNYIAEKVPAILEGWYLGQEGGTAAANVIFGDVNPGGKLPITFPRSVGNLPDFYNHKPSANRTYAFSTRKPLFPFGYGLSYTTFSFDNLRVEPTQIISGATAKVSVDLTNSGSREGDEVPQLYIHQRVASITRPVMELKAFRRITLKPGEKKTVVFNVTPEMLSMLDIDMHRVVEPGVFDLMVGPSSDQTRSVALTVLGPHGETGKPLPPPPPAGSESGVVSTFDEGKVSSNYGSWIVNTDEMTGGKSKASLAIAEPGADGSKGALKVSGEIIPGGGQFSWAGAMFTPASAPMEPANLSNKKEISFWAKGDGDSYILVVLTAARSGQNGMPAMTSFVATREWKQYTFPFTTFQTDGSDIMEFLFAASQPPGKFEFQIDQVEIK
ncbi:MAG TPA: CIA30 family protein [Candidatus Binatia bacterium]|nr:CIA30 family protein [Candidatus Binatia bacterium]